MSRARSVADLGNQNVLDVSAGAGTLKVGAGATIENTGEVQFAGIVTAQQFAGDITGVAGTFTGNLSVGGVLTYEDVTSVDSVGVITARSGIDVGTGTSISSPSSNVLALGTNSEERVRITSGGKIGIGTDNPTSNLTIAEDGASTNAELAINYTGSGNRTSAIRFQRGGTDYGYIAGAGFMLTTGAQDDLAIAPVSGKNLLFGIGNSEKLRVTAGGNVGVNTSTFPANGTNIKVSDGTISRLSLDKTGSNARNFEIGNLGTALNIYDITADAERLRISSDGLVGIGTDNPKSDLQISNSGGLQVVNSNEIALRYNMYYSGGDKYIQSSGKASSFVMNSAGDFIFYNTNTGSSAADSDVSGLTSKLLLTSAGDMGLGSSSPYNSAGYTSLTIDNDTTGSQIRMRTAGNDRGLIYNTNTEFAIYAHNNIPINLYGAGRVLSTLDYEGQLKLDSQTNVGFALWRKQSPIIIAQYGDYARPVIALSYHRTTGTLNFSGFFGDVIASRGGTGAGHIPIFCKVCVSSAYSTNMRSSLGLGSSVFQFVTFTYDGNNYQGIQYNTDASANILLDGWYATRGFKPFSVAASSVTSLTAVQATTDARLSSTASTLV